MDYYEIGQRIRSCRRAMGLSQEQLAEQVSISTTHMSHIETGATKLSLPVLVSLAEALGTSTDSLLFEEKRLTKSASLSRIAELLEDCSPAQAQILGEILQSAKASLEKHHI